MTRWFTSDTHFGHERIIELAKRPFKNADEMNETIIDNWNALVQPDDFVFHLGDVALGKIADTLPLVGRLNGRKILVVGNHDRLFSTNKISHRHRFLPEYEKVFQSIIGERGMAGVLDDGTTVNLSHFPYSGDSHADERHTPMRMEDLGLPILHGHTHADNVVTFSDKGSLQIHVGVDAWQYAPVAEDDIIDILHEEWSTI